MQIPYGYEEGFVAHRVALSFMQKPGIVLYYSEIPRSGEMILSVSIWVQNARDRRSRGGDNCCPQP